MPSRSSVLLILALCECGIGRALAADSSTSGVAADSAATLDEVVVTAQKRTESLQSTALAITAISGPALEEQGVTNSLDAIQFVPSVQVQQTNTGAVFYIRGIGTRGVTADSPVSVMQDGIYQPLNEVTNAGFFDLNRIEVLRGPQGTLYGRNANAGLVNILTNDPQLQKLEGSASIQAGNYSAIRSEGVINLPMGDTLALRATFGTNYHTGYLTDGLQDADEKLARAKLLWQPMDSLRFLVTVESLWNNSAGPGNVLLPTSGRSNPWEGPAFSSLYSIPFGNPIFCNPDCRAQFDYHNYNYTAQADWDLGFAALTALGGHQDFTRTYQQPFSGLWEKDYKPYGQDSGEIRLAAPSASPIKWVVGLYALNEDFSGEFRQTYTFGSVLDFRENTEHSRAAFGQLTFPITQRFRLTGGLRYTKDTLNLDMATGSVDPTTAVLSPLTLAAPFAAEFSKTTYKAGFEFDVTDQSLLYADTSTGYKSGGIDSTGGPYGPEFVKAYEAGSKNRFLDERLQINADVFYYIYSGYQLSYYVYRDQQPLFITSNVPGNTHIYGVEAEGVYLLTTNDRVEFSGSYERSRFGDATICTNADPVSGACTTQTNLNGIELPRIPHFTGTVSYAHHWDLPGNARLTAQADGQYKTSYYVDLLRFNNSQQNNYSLWNARLTYSADSDRWSLGAYVNNIGNKAVLQQANTAGPVNVYGVIGDPRTFGAVLSVRF